MSKAKVFVTRKLPDLIETRLIESFDCELNLDDRILSIAELTKGVQSAEILVPTVTDKIDRELIAKAGPQLRLIASFGTGYDHIDVKYAQERGITVTNTPDVLTEDTADMTMALILAVSRRLGEGERLVRSGGWQGWAPTSMLGHRIWGKRLGIIGMGRIGQALARRAKGFGLHVHYHNRNRLSESVESALEANWWQSLDQLITHMDIISLNCPHTPATYHLLNARRLKLMRSHAIIVNTARGEVVDEAALITALSSKNIAGAGLDVFVNEPKINPKLLKLDNVVLMPHMGSATIEGRLQMGEKVMANIRAFLDGHTPPDIVSKTMF